ncbi:DNA/pantothenate metabolism flavoprotein [Sedimentisphaera cyanobacteriorum]|uniref:DNA/pantothenate metabolism flavoprotein n=1 Tax=Sedimentisphaera cyanobacteriorum TaxID=1940790 RepID=A0A1Q2HMS3_9BACT|nr:phosphopantothenoylcysteine decarboxylase [Sedimentisphaera cyanobacteriorum]AQQ08591.1 DNA/pantothenate metabolism flavoprotein [Sedimentisphaera cyanobacteriorum]
MRILVTAGGTREYIDPVRYITNASTGKMGYAAAAAAIDSGHSVKLISAPTSIAHPKGAELLSVVSAEEMFEAVKNEFSSCDCLIMAAAVSDYCPERYAEKKIKKSKEKIELIFHKTPDILEWAGDNKNGQIIVGFALEDENLLEKAEEKMQRKKMDIIIANDPSAISQECSQIYIKQTGGEWLSRPERHKSETAVEIIRMAGKIHSQRTGKCT